MTTTQDDSLIEYVRKLEKELNLAPVDTTSHSTPSLVNYACALLAVIKTKGATT